MRNGLIHGQKKGSEQGFNAGVENLLWLKMFFIVNLRFKLLFYQQRQQREQRERLRQ